jgi:predicted MPP superfamily phosphohydrolase
MPSADVTHLILRFRDLATAPGETLARHRAIRHRKGYVWWGWWNKFGEQVPTELFTRLSTAARQSALDWHLFDSGQNRLHRIKCQDIVWDPQERQRIPSPEQDATPDYYKTQRYFAWFKLTELPDEVVNDNILQQFAYEEVTEFFESGHSQFLPFYGKRVDAPLELQQQNRTIWFLRLFKAGDRTGVVDFPTGRPTQAFSTDPLASHSRTILWLSDVHFGQHSFPLQTDHNARDLSQAIEYDLGKIGENSVGAAIISGDLTWENSAEEFGHARALCTGIRSWSALDYRRMIVCPGNHDLAFTPTPAASGTPVTIAAPLARERYEAFYRELFNHSPNAFLSAGRRFLLGGAIPVDVVAVNSSLLEQAREAFQGQGFVGDAQLQHAVTAMGWDSIPLSAPRAFRILVIHHHLIPVIFRPIAQVGYSTSVTFDAEAITRWIVEHRIDLVLHGHMHTPFIAGLSRPITGEHKWHSFKVVGAGSSGVDVRHLTDQERFNTYGLLQFEKGFYRVVIRRLNSQNSVPDNQQVVWQHDIPYTHLS